MAGEKEERKQMARDARLERGREYEEPRNTMEIHVIVLCTNVAV